MTLGLWALIMAIVLLLVSGEHRREVEQLSLETRITGEQVQLRLEACLRSRFALVQTLADVDWSDGDAIRRGWTARAEPLVALMPGVLALNFVDPGYVIRVVVPEARNAGALNRDLGEARSPSVSGALARAADGQLARTNVVELLQGGRGLAAYSRIQDAQGDLLGLVSGVFRLEPLMEACLGESSLDEGFQLALFEVGADEAFFANHDAEPSRPGPTLQSYEVAAADRPITMHFAPWPKVLAGGHLQSHLWEIVVGAVFATLAAFLVWLLLKHRRSLRESRERFRFLVENQTDFLIQLDADGNLAYASPNYLRGMGVPEEELLGHRFSDSLTEESRELWAVLHDELQESPFMATSDLHMQTRSGPRVVAWSFAATPGDGGDVEILHGSGRDVTDLRLLEHRMAHSEKMKALGEMAGGITHDFNNLLQVTLGNLELLKLEANETKLDQIESVEGALRRALVLTEKLGTLSHQPPIDQQTIRLAAFFSEMVGLLRHTLPATITLRFDAHDPDLCVHGDPGQLEQVLLNLVFNARDSIEGQGTICIELNCATLDDAVLRDNPSLEAGVYVGIAVRDDGSGIPADVLGKIFDPLFTTKGLGAGQGLGLSNCETIVRQHGGVITVTSKPGEGSTFTVFLPLVDPPADSGDSAEEAVPRDEAVTPTGQLILIADDSKDIRELVARVLDAAGYRTVTADNGHDAVLVYEEHQTEIAMVLLDLVMPIMDGQTAAVRIRALSSRVPILFMTGYVPAGEMEGVRGSTVLRKPFKRDALLEATKGALRETGRAAD